MIAVPGGTVVLRALLLLWTALGIAAMHTLGHPGNHGSSTVTSSHATLDVQAHAVVVPAEVMALPAAATPEVAPSLPGDGLDPTQVCLAVLTLAGLAVLVVAGLLAVHRRAPVCAVARTAAPVCYRAPPRPWFGLVLTDLSVLRR